MTSSLLPAEQLGLLWKLAITVLPDTEAADRLTRDLLSDAAASKWIQSLRNRQFVLTTDVGAFEELADAMALDSIANCSLDSQRLLAVYVMLCDLANPWAHVWTDVCVVCMACDHNAGQLIKCFYLQLIQTATLDSLPGHERALFEFASQLIAWSVVESTLIRLTHMPSYDLKGAHIKQPRFRQCVIEQSHRFCGISEQAYDLFKRLYMMTPF